MNSNRTRAACGAPLPQDAPRGFCPECLLRLGAQGLPTSPEALTEPKLAPPSESQGPAAAESDPGANARIPEAPGTMIGRYKILQLIGEGGMGSVFMAEQQEPIRRRVALKIIK